MGDLSSIGLFAAVVLICAVSVFLIRAVYEDRLLPWRDRHGNASILLDFLLMSIILNMFIITVLDTAGQELWSSDHLSAMIVSVGLPLLSAWDSWRTRWTKQDQSRQNKIHNIWVRVRPLLMGVLLCLMIWRLGSWDFGNAAIYALLVLLLFIQIHNEKGRQT